MNRPVSWLLAAVCLLGAAGCTTEPAPPPSPSPTAASDAPEPVDLDLIALEAMITEMDTTTAALRTELEAAADGDADALERAAELLTADVPAVLDPSSISGDGETDGGDDTTSDDDGDTSDDGDATGDSGQTDDSGQQDGDPADDVAAGDPDEPAPVLPGPLASRAESIQYGDLLTRTLAAARSAGDDGAPVLRFLADPLAGDLGAWQRAPDDQLAAIGTAGAAGDLDATEQAVLDLTGEAPRALAWVVHGLQRPDEASEAAGRALAHLAIIELSLDQLA